jgi:hypothetical protein
VSLPDWLPMTVTQRHRHGSSRDRNCQSSCCVSAAPGARFLLETRHLPDADVNFGTSPRATIPRPRAEVSSYQKLIVGTSLTCRVVAVCSATGGSLVPTVAPHRRRSSPPYIETHKQAGERRIDRTNARSQACGLERQHHALGMVADLRSGAATSSGTSCAISTTCRCA